MKQPRALFTLQRICPVLLSLVLFFAFPLSLSAESGDTQDATLSATVIAANVPSYEITIPESIGTDQLNRTSGTALHTETFTISIANVSFLNGRRICVRLYSEDGTFQLYHAETNTPLPYLVYGPASASVPMQNGDVFAYYTEDDADKSYTGSIVIDQKDIRAEGTYTGSVNFAVSIEEGSTQAEEE